MKVALVHDDLVQWGGAERVLLALSELYPQAPIYTSVYNGQNPILAQYFRDKLVVTSFLQTVPGWKNFYRQLLPLYPLAFEQFIFDGFDLVISHTTRFAKAVITKPGTRHICYCHTPVRFLWNFSGEKHNRMIDPYFNLLRLYDRVAARRVDHWIAGSANARQRIKKVYQAEAEVVYPFVDWEKFDGTRPFDGGYLLAVARLNRYKRVDLAVKASRSLGIPLKVVGSGPQERYLKSISPDTVDFLGQVSEDKLRRLLAGCQCLIVAGEEDFGLMALEAQALGKAVVALGAGGSLETVKEGVTGFLFDKPDEDSLADALEKLRKIGYNQKACLENARRFSKDNFKTNFRQTVAKLL